jgi:hypothetical protein
MYGAEMSAWERAREALISTPYIAGDAAKGGAPGHDVFHSPSLLKGFCRLDAASVTTVLTRPE